MRLEHTGDAGLLQQAQAPPPLDEHDLSCFHVDIGLELEDQRYIARPFTPMSAAAEYNKGFMSVIVKTYTQGKFTPLLAAAAVGTFSLNIQTPSHRCHTITFSPCRQLHLLLAHGAHPYPPTLLLLPRRHIRWHRLPPPQPPPFTSPLHDAVQAYPQYMRLRARF